MHEASLFREEAVQARQNRFRGSAEELPGFNAWKWLCIAAGLLSAIGLFVACTPTPSSVRIAVSAVQEGDQWKLQLRNSQSRAWFPVSAAETVCGAALEHGQWKGALADGHAAQLIIKQGRSTLLRRLMERTQAHVESARVIRCLEELG